LNKKQKTNKETNSDARTIFSSTDKSSRQEKERGIGCRTKQELLMTVNSKGRHTTNSFTLCFGVMFDPISLRSIQFPSYCEDHFVILERVGHALTIITVKKHICKNLRAYRS
jgi:hypothetical protein